MPLGKRHSFALAFVEMEPLRTDGKFFRAGPCRVHLTSVTYGPFPGGWPESFDEDFARIAGAGFDSIRLYDMPGRTMLDAALRHGLRVFGGLKWASGTDFFRHPEHFSAAKVVLTEHLRATARHPALAGVYVGNEIPADLVRWMGPAKVRQAMEELIATGRQTAPDLLFAYGNYPSTEYLEPDNADFTAFNVYLEDEAALRRYLKRLHHLAGDRPVVVSEFGLDSQRHGFARQAELLARAATIAREEETAGFTVFAWSDRWHNGGEVLDWDFGLIDREGRAKPALEAISNLKFEISNASSRVSVIVCTRNGRDRIGTCLRAIGRMVDANFETIVVDDGSTDGTAEFVAETFPGVRLLRLKPGGLSRARNEGAAAASGEILAFTDDDCEPDIEWVTRLRKGFANGPFAAAGGPNLAPPAQSLAQAVVSAAPGAPSHVMLDDVEAEHLPGCNLAVTKAAFDAIEGFDPQFHTAGDDVDFCWRLRDAGYRLGFVPGAFVWHWRRPSLRAFLRQQRGYGIAERLLLAKHPRRFNGRGEAKWDGFVYQGGPVRAGEGSVIYYGPMGLAGYQSVTDRMMPLRPLEPRFDSPVAHLLLAALKCLQPRVRSWARNRTLRWEKFSSASRSPAPTREWEIWSPTGKTRDDFLRDLLADGWKPGGETDLWDVEKSGTRVQLATEQCQGPGKRTLVRVWGSAAEVKWKEE
jgi:GT2 family glycosyltransferase